MRSANTIIIPPYYSGTSFEDIVGSLIVAAKKSKKNIRFMGYIKPLNNSITSQSTLDDNRYTEGQLGVLRKLIESSKGLDKVLFLDFFNPGLDLFKYSLVQTGDRVKIGSLLHGGSFVPGDIYNYNWIKNFERGWMNVNDRIYASSRYLKNACPSELKKKVKIYPWGLDSFKPKKSIVNNWDVIFPHRLQTDKGVLEFIEIVKLLPNVHFLVTSPLTHVNLLKNVYYKKLIKSTNVEFAFQVDNKNIVNYLSQSKIVLSCSIQETFGYSVMKSVACGCYPILPNRACYPEFFTKKFRYDSIKEARDLITNILADAGGKHQTSISKMSLEAKFSFLPLLNDFFNE